MIALEVAEAELNRFADLMDLDFDTSVMDEEDSKEFTSHKERLIKALCAGNLTINDDGEPTYTCKRGDKRSLTFKEPTGAALMAMDKRKHGEQTAKTYAMMAEITGQEPKAFATMKMVDLKVCSSITMLFMG